MKKIPTLLFIILIIAFSLRVYKLNDWFYFNMDEALLAFRGWGIWDLGRFFIIGGISPLGFHLPPYFYWFSALFLPILNYNPVIWGYLSAFLSVITIFFLYLWVEYLGGKKLAFSAAVIYCFSFLAIFFDRHYWPLTLNPLFAILTLWLLTIKNKHKWFFLSLILVFAVTADPSNIPLLILVVYSLSPINKNFKEKITSIITFCFIFFLPLVVFDIRHQGSNIRGASRLLDKAVNQQFNPSQLTSVLLLPARVFSQFWYSGQNNISFLYTYCSRFASGIRMSQLPVLQFLAGFFIIIFVIRKLKFGPKKEINIAWLLIIYYLGLIIYGVFVGGAVFEHYMAGLLPVFALITAKLLTRFWLAGFFILLIFVSFNLNQYLQAVNPYGLKETQKAVDWTLNEVGNEPFALDSISECFRYNGIRYLYEIKNQPPAISFIDPDFFWLYRNPPLREFPSKVVVFTDEQLFFRSRIINQSKFGNWQVYILDNTDKKYRIEGL